MIPHSRPTVGDKDADAVVAVLRSGQVAQGPRVEAFEHGLAAFVGRRGGVAVSSGTAALELALRCLGVGAGDEVLLPSYVCMAPWLATMRVGAQARLVDIDPCGYALDPVEAAKALSRRTRAIIVPHLFGLPADLTGLQERGVPLIEDCAQTLGATETGRAVGSVGAISICSFYATKLLCTGEGGMLLADDPALLDKARGLREYDERVVLQPAAFNYKMTDLHAALGLQQLSTIHSLLERRVALAARYQAALVGTGLLLPEVPKGRTHIYYRYVVRLDPVRHTKVSLDRLLEGLERRGVQCRRPVFRPLHRYLGIEGFPRTEEVMATAFSLPIYPSLTDAEAEQVIHAVHAETEAL
jgi:dTDP-4-amino-4,6-dideoxygalactose transaminase